MAIPIKSTPGLTGETAERFIKAADNSGRGIINFTKEVEISRRIIEKAFNQELISNQTDIEPEIQESFNKNFWDLI